MARYLVSYRMVCNGTISVEANTVEDAEKAVENTELSILGKEADDGEVEIVSTLPQEG